jgi:hypothetical protein
MEQLIFTEIENLHPKIDIEPQKTQMHFWGNKAGDSTPPNFKTHSKLWKPI